MLVKHPSILAFVSVFALLFLSKVFAAQTLPIVKGSSQNSQPSSSRTDSDDATLILSTDKASYTPEEPIRLTLVIRNTGSSTLYFRDIFPVDAPDLSVVRERDPLYATPDMETGLTAYGLRWHHVNTYAGGMSILEPGWQTTIVQQIDRIRDMSESGRYRLSLKMHIHREGLPTPPFDAVSNTVEITVTESNDLPTSVDSRFSRHQVRPK